MHRDAFVLGRNYLLSLGGEGLQSGFHFGLNLLLIRLLVPYDYGVFAIVFILGGISLTYGNAMVSIPANVHIARLNGANAADFYDVVFGSVALVVCGVAAVMVTAGLALTIRNLAEAGAGGLFTGLWTLRNHLRNTMFARQAMSTGTLSDLCYAAAGIMLIVGLWWFRADALNATVVLLVLACANVIGIAVALLAAGRRIRISFRPGVRRLYRSVWPDIGWSLIWVTTWNIQGQGLMFLVAAIVGPAAYAPIAAGLVLFGPLRTGLGALINVIRPEFSSDLAANRHSRVRFTLFGAFGLVVAVCLALGAFIWLGWPVLTAHIYGEKFAGAAMPLIVTLAWINALVYVSYHVPLALVQAAREFKAVAISTTIGGIVGISLVTLLLEVSSVAWSLAGAAAGEAAALVYIWIAAVRILKSPRPIAGRAGGHEPRAPAVSEWHS
jgi:O-antigen/teichoic acid export membrane protein